MPFMVLNDGGIARVEDLKGKVIATNGAGGAFDVAMRWMLHQHGLDDKRDYNAIESDYANMPAMLLSRKAALITGANPWARSPDMQAKAHVLFTAARCARPLADDDPGLARRLHRGASRGDGRFLRGHDAGAALVSRPHQSRRGGRRSPPI